MSASPGRGRDVDAGRRAVLRGALAACVAHPFASAFAAEPQGFFARRRLPIGLQLYTLGDAVRTDLDGSFAKLARIGYRVLEPAGWHGHAPRALAAAAARHGLKCTSIHVPAKGDGDGPGLEGDVPRLAAAVHALGATDVVMGMFPVPQRLGQARQGEAFPAFIQRVASQLKVDDWKRTAALLAEKGAALRSEGLRLSYHNHNVEFGPVGGTTGMDILLRETSPDAVVFELDVGWAAAAGVDPLALLRAHERRFQLMHVKDIRASTKRNFALRMDPTEVGGGSVEWERLLPAAFAAGVRKYYVEQEPPFTLDRFEAAERSYRYLATLGQASRV
jgi:sugar phosphate isomerase/epimerase